jgi:16S rRNA processing protein RimM
MITADQLTEIGRLGKPHGINGEINAYLDCDIDLNALKRIVLLIDGIYVPFFIASTRPKSSDTVILGLDDIDNERKAAEFTNHSLYVLRADNVVVTDEDGDDINDEGFYASDLIGFTIIEDESGNTIGEIDDIDDSTDNVLFIVITPNDDTIYLPVADEFITAIDTDNRTIAMNLPEGILEQ